MHRETEREETSVVFFLLPTNRGGGGRPLSGDGVTGDGG
jgi:hypothetical protein